MGLTSTIAPSHPILNGSNNEKRRHNPMRKAKIKSGKALKGRSPVRSNIFHSLSRLRWIIEFVDEFVEVSIKVVQVLDYFSWLQSPHLSRS